MVSDTRSGRHFKDNLDSSNLKRTSSNGKDLSQHRSLKSECLEKGIPSLTPRVKRNSGKPEIQHTPSPMRMSDRRNKNVSSSSSGSQQSVKELELSGQREKENCDQATMESKKTKLDVDSLFMNENKMNGRTFKGLFKRQRILETVVGVDGKLDEPYILSHACADYPDRDGVKDCKKSFNVSEKLPGNLLSINVDAPEPGCSSSLHITQVGAINSESGELFISSNVVESIPSSSPKCENEGLLGTCVLCSKIKRVNRGSANQELCSCGDVVNEDISCSLSTREERLSHFVLNKSNSEESKFLEYWVPSQMSNLQLELYCSTLLTNSIPLRSCSRNDSVGALRHILLNIQKCCDHPYLVDSSLQEDMIAEKRPAAEVLDVGIKVSGKLQLLDAMLTESMTQGIKTLILYQSICRTGGASIGDILDDFLRQKYGANTYERVDARVSISKRQAAVNRFNTRESGQFAFLLEKRACSSTIKRLAVDVIIVFDSNWNPANDIRALQKISIDSKAIQMKVFRLYSSCTVEERALVLAKKNLKLDNNLRTFSRTTSDSLLKWGASYLFNQLDDYHACSNNAALIISSGQSVLNEVTQEFKAILSERCKNTRLSMISEVRLSAENYSINIPLLGESKNQLKDGEEPYIFWKNLLDRKDPPWRHFRGSSPRNRKRVQYMDESPGATNDKVRKRHKMVIHENSNPSSVQSELGEQQVTLAACSDGGGSSNIVACDNSKSFWTESVTSSSYLNCKYGQSYDGLAVDVGDPEGRGVLVNEQKKFFDFLEGETIKLCQILKLSEVVMDMVRRFLKYVIQNHQVSTDSPAYVQALQISVCLIAASILKQKVDKRESLMSIKQLLDYQCTEEQVTSVYSRLRGLKRIYLQSAENFVESDNLLVEEGISMEPYNVDEEHAEGPISIQEKMAMEDEVTESEVESKDRNEVAVAPSVTSMSAPSEPVCTTHTETVSDDTRPVVINKEVPKVVPDRIPNGVVSCFTPLKLANTPDEKFDYVEAVGLIDAVQNPRNQPDEVTIDAIPAPEQQLARSEQIASSTDCCSLLPQQVPGDPQNLVSAELRLENQSSTLVEVSTSQLTHDVNPLLSTHGALEIENHEQLHSESVDVTLSCNQFPTVEVEHQNDTQGISSLSTAVAGGEGEVLLHEPSSESQENSQLHGNHLDPSPGARVQELPDDAALHLEINAGHLSWPNHLHTHGTHQVTTCNSTPALSAEPLQIELERMPQEFENLQKSHKDVISQLKSKCEMEIQEIITKIRSDYDMKLKTTEAEYMLKKNELVKNQALVLMNKMLAELLRSKFLDHRPSGLLGTQQESLRQHLRSASTVRSSVPATQVIQGMRRPSLPESTGPSPLVTQVMQGMLQPSLPESTRPSALATQVMHGMWQPSLPESAGPSPLATQVMQGMMLQPSLPESTNPSSPATQGMRQPSLLKSTRTSPITDLNYMVPPVQRAPALSSSTPSRPPVIGAITTSSNPHTSGEIRAMAPHLKLFRPPAASSGHPVVPPFLQPRPTHILISQPPPTLAQQMQANPVSQVRPYRQIVPPTLNVDLSGLQ